MRLWLKDSERRPDPTPVPTDDRKAIVVGIALWCVAFAVMLIVPAVTAEEISATWLFTCLVGLALGLVGLVYTHRRHSR
jgi:FtsH-binding integral membrane protein